MYNYAKRVATMARTADVVRKLFQATTDPEVLNFATGSPANATIPREDICAFAQQILSDGSTGYKAHTGAFMVQ